VKLTVPEWVRQTVYLAPVTTSSFHIPAGPRQIRVIGVVPGQLLTRSVVAEPSVRDGSIVADPARDLVKIAVLERHHASGRAGLGASIAAPFMTLSFLALSVIPELKITDRGLVDVARFELVPLGIE